MVLQTYQPREQSDRCLVTITPTAFRFNVEASKLANLGGIHWMRIHIDPDDRLVVFEPVQGLDRPSDVLKLGTQKPKEGKPEGYKNLTAKGLISKTPWIKALVGRPVKDRKFEMKEFPGPPKSWYIQLMPAFEKSISPSEINQLDSSQKGIYRYRGGYDGEEVIYIGKGSIRDRYVEESTRQNWGVTQIEYSILQDDQTAYEWESWWIKRFKEENNGSRPRHNFQDGHG